MNEMTTIGFDISYAEDAVTLLARIDASPNQEKAHRVRTLQEALKLQNIPHEAANEGVRVYLQGEGDVEKVLECFRFFGKQDKIRETKIHVHRQIASELEKKLKTIFPPPEAQISIKHDLSASL